MSKPNMLDKTLKLLFRTTETQRIAQILLVEIRDRQNAGKPYTADEYHNFCKLKGIEEQKYQSVLSKLRQAGLVVKKGGHHAGTITLNSHFILYLLKEWNEFLGVEYGKPT